MHCVHLHACAAGPVDDDSLACLVYIVLHAKVGRYPMDQHTVVGRHVRELLKGTEMWEETGKVKKKKNIKRGEEGGRQ